MARSSLLGIDPAPTAAPGRDAASLGPGDSSDSGSDVAGLEDDADPAVPVDVALRGDQPAPLPLNQGMRGWFWTGHHVWTDERAPAARLYGHRVSQPNNWDWTLNQAHIVLTATATPGELAVELDTVTPGLAPLWLG